MSSLDVSRNRDIKINVEGGSFDAYVAAPATPGPAVIVIGSVFGVTASLRVDCDALAAAGFLAIAPDLFWRTDRGPLSREPEERTRAFARYGAFDIDLGVADVKTTMNFAREQPEHRGGVAVLGYCFGGLFAYLATSRLGADAGIAFHGTKIGEFLEEHAAVSAPLSLHFGEADDSVPMTEVDAIRSAFADRSDVKIYTYPGAKHGFTQTDAPSYDSAAALSAMKYAVALLSSLK
jgi:carboxymethylenebutenolidase